MNEARIKYLLRQYCGNALSIEESEEFRVLLNLNDHKEVFEKVIEDQIAEQEPGQFFVEYDYGALLQKVTGIDKTGKKQPTIRSIRARTIWWSAAAILLIACGVYFYKESRPIPQETVTQTGKQDIKAPASNRATIALANGQKIFLDSLGNGIMKKQGSAELEKKGAGSIVYNDNGQPKETIYNTLTNPRGSRVVDITLADGTRIWLNAESSLTYPVAFAGKDREVSITGEGYFEVAKDPKRPFRVQVNKVEIEVLGTHFNISGYADENNIRTTLLEGSVRISSGDRHSAHMLKPGEQAIVDRTNGDAQIKTGIDLDEVMAWKNGSFEFNGTDLKTIMNELARWYDADIEYGSKIPTDRFFGIVSRSSNLSEVLKIMEGANVHFKIDGKKVIVMP
ncbi:MAG TPA: FecR domain-containing protein [Puia sp.]|nr:FecR domain-containing protein [Puia sp.]